MPPDLIFMDCIMPEMDGIETIGHIRLRLSAAELPIVAMWSQRGAETCRCMLAAGSNDFLAKPLNPQQLLAAVARYLA